MGNCLLPNLNIPVLLSCLITHLKNFCKQAPSTNLNLSAHEMETWSDSEKDLMHLVSWAHY